MDAIVRLGEQHLDAEHQFPLPFDPLEKSAAGIVPCNSNVVEHPFNPEMTTSFVAPLAMPTNLPSKMEFDRS